MDLREARVGELCFGAFEERAHELRPLLRGALELVRAELHDLLDALVVGPGTQGFRRRCIVLAIHPPAVHEPDVQQVEDGEVARELKTAVELHVDIQAFRQRRQARHGPVQRGAHVRVVSLVRFHQAVREAREHIL